jgi:hypothetical protein
MHNTGLGTATSSLYVYPAGNNYNHAAVGVGTTAFRLARIDIDANETFFFEPNYPIVLAHDETLVVEVTAPALVIGGTGIGTIMNYQVLGDTDIN